MAGWLRKAGNKAQTQPAGAGTWLSLAITPSVQGNKKIWEFMKKKKARIDLVQPEQPENPVSMTYCKEDNPSEDNRNEDNKQQLPELHVVKNDMKTTKKTYNTFNMLHMTRKTSVSDRTLRFQELTDGDECVIGSGRCATHNEKVVRKVMNVRKSVQNEAGEVRWRLSESTVLACPVAHHRTPISPGVVTSSNSEGGTPMGIQRFLQRSSNQNTVPDEINQDQVDDSNNF